ncbi:MAG TPA: hypothetical protein VFD41_07435 [Actinomycetales bacterium]|nr:hypothetical protein [Actinomycetales bacterium]
MSSPARTTAAAGTADDAGRLGTGARAWRAVLLVALVAGFLGGSLVGNDHWWPFSPWRMFSTSTSPDASVTVSAIQVQVAGDPTWVNTGLNPENVGLNRAEVEGRQLEIEDDPAMLGTLAEAHARLHPADEEWTGVRLVRRSTVLEDRSPTGETRERVVAEWTASGGGRLVDQ